MSVGSPDRVVVLNDASVARGGATELALASVRGLCARGIPVTLICGDDASDPALAALGVECVGLDQPRLLGATMGGGVLRGLYNRRAITAVTDWIRANDTPRTIYHLHGWSQVLSPSVFEALASVRRRLLVSAHDFFLVCPNGAYAFFSDGSPCSLTPMGLACVVASCDRRHYAHKLWRVARQAVQGRLLHHGPDGPRILAIHDAMRPILVRGGVPDAAVTTLPNPIRAWSATRIVAERNQEILYVGRLDREKGPDLAAAAARRAGVPLRIVGDGPMRGDLQDAYPEVAFEGRRTGAELAVIAARARVLVMPSRYPEPFGLVAGEALWSGVPVIVPPAALMAPSILAAGAGLACDPRDQEGFAAMLRDVGRDDAAVGEMSHRAFAATRHLGLTPEAWVEALLDLYGTACSPGPTTGRLPSSTLGLSPGRPSHHAQPSQRVRDRSHAR